MPACSPDAAEAGKLGSTMLELWRWSSYGYYDSALTLRDVATGKRLWATLPYDPSGYFEIFASASDDGYVYTTEASDVSGPRSCLRHAANGSIAVCADLRPPDEGEDFVALPWTCAVRPGVKTDGYSNGNDKVYIFDVAAHGTPVTSLANFTLPPGTLDAIATGVRAAAPGLVLVNPGNGLVYAYETKGSNAGKMLWTFNYTAAAPQLPPSYAWLEFVSSSKETVALTVTTDYTKGSNVPGAAVLMGMDRTSGKQLWTKPMDSRFDWCSPNIKYTAISILCQGRKPNSFTLNGNWWLLSTVDGSVTDHGTLPADPADGDGLLQTFFPIGGGIVLYVEHLAKNHSTVAFLPALSAKTRAWSRTFPLGTKPAPASDNKHIVLFMDQKGAVGLNLQGKVLWDTTNEEELEVDGVKMYPDPEARFLSHAIPFDLDWY
jgi:hypothetical protein